MLFRQKRAMFPIYIYFVRNKHFVYKICKIEFGITQQVQHIRIARAGYLSYQECLRCNNYAWLPRSIVKNTYVGSDLISVFKLVPKGGVLKGVALGQRYALSPF